MEELMKQLIEQVKGMRADLSAGFDRIGAGIQGIQAHIQVPSEDGPVISIGDMMSELIDITDENAQRLQWMCDRQAEAIEAVTSQAQSQVDATSTTQ